MAQAVKRLYPDVKLAIGPAIDSGFYYDFDAAETFTMEDLGKIEAEMKKNCEESPSERFTLSRAEALDKMRDEPYKAELINDLPEDAELSFLSARDFTDLWPAPICPIPAGSRR